MEHKIVVLHNNIPSLSIKRESLLEHTHVRTGKPRSLQRLAFPSRWRTPHSAPTSLASVYSLGLSHEFGYGFGARGQWVIDHRYESEERGGRVSEGGFCYSDSGGVWTADNVVEEEVKVAELLLLESQRLGR
ncbi:hypothetical protein VNO80_03725 [Phaseolus coccineus]|uniref:Uncharacterized protein n=1 Tax=Phaseolus coccineus TaxID=3886 RepID=A0AAN9NS86_PHACN